MGKLLRNHRRNTSPFDIIEKKDNMKAKSIEVEALVAMYMDEKEKELLLHLLEKANEEGLLNVYDCEEKYHSVERVFLDRGEFYFQIN